MKRKIFCTIPQDLIKDPILYALGTKFNVVPNIRGASVTDEIALLALELEGAEADVAAAIEYLKERQVKIEDLPEGGE